MSDDDRNRCTECALLIASHCTQPKRAGLSERFGKAEIGPELAQLLQRCPAFRQKVQEHV